MKSLKKAELHAHLFGSIKQEQILGWMKRKNMTEDVKKFQSIKDQLSMDVIFAEAFSFLPKLVKTQDDLTVLSDLVIDNFIQDNVTYLELRSSPKKIESNCYSDYLNILIDSMKKHEDKIKVRHIVSLNRDYDVKVYEDLLESLKRVPESDKYIVGFDFCGDCQKSKFSEYRPFFERIRDKGFKITIHAPEREGM